RALDPSERCGKADPCHDTTRVATCGNAMLRFAGTFYGRYWARTSDPQLVERGLESLRALAQAAWLSQLLPVRIEHSKRQIAVDSARFGGVWAQNSRLCPTRRRPSPTGLA